MLRVFRVCVIAGVCWTAGCTGKTSADCSSPSDCTGGSVCIDGKCAPVCNQDRDCQKSERCDAGTCVAVTAPACSSDFDCVSPTDCRTPIAAECYGGTCHYTCRTPCVNLADCPTGEYCQAAGGCAATIANGGDCTSDGDPSCDSGHCNNGVCCQAGNCCVNPSDCPPTFSVVSQCADTSTGTNCQGSRWDATCVSFVCGSSQTDDDAGCSGLAHDCSAYAPVICTGAVTQTAPVCAGGCTFSTECSSGHGCVGGSCQTIVGLGASCTGSGQGTCDTGLKCENAVCCVSTDPTCCTTSGQCASGLGCDTGTSSCYSSCNDYDSSRCANPSTRYCLSNGCVAKLADGAGPCVDNGECLNGHCIDGVCCSTTCNTVCQACAASLTGLASGVCGDIAVGGTDDAPSPLCTSSGTGCAASTCACDGNGGCEASDNAPCDLPGDCASNVCECFNALCTDTRCRATACGQCQIAVPGAGCIAGLGSPKSVDDPSPADGCDGPLSCYAGNCRKDNGQLCGANTECGNVCVGGVCGSRSALGGACETADGNADCEAGLVCAGAGPTGMCRATTGSGCNSPSDCATGFCVNNTCCGTACTGPCAVCNASPGTCTMPVDDAACGTVACSSLNGATQCRSYPDMTTNRCAAIGTCKTANTTYCTAYTDDNARCGFCQKCAAASCSNQLNTEDLKNECSPANASCGNGLCNGAGGCTNYGSSTTCNTSDGCASTCNGAGDCTSTCTCSVSCGVLCPSSECTTTTACMIAPSEPGIITRTCGANCNAGMRCE